MYRFVAIICTCTDIISLLKFHDRLLIFLRLTLLLIIFDIGHEHPTFASSWKEPSIKKIIDNPDNIATRIHMSAYNMKIPDKYGNEFIQTYAIPHQLTARRS